MYCVVNIFGGSLMKVNFALQKNSTYYRSVSAKAKDIKQRPNVGKSADKNFIALSFTANPLKNLSQVASIAPEYQGMLAELYKIGGLGNVAGEASVAFQDYGNMDFRTFVPYYSPDNKSGGIKIRKPNSNGGFEYVSVPVDYKLKDRENFVIHEAVTQQRPIEKTKFQILNDTGIKGFVDTISDDLETTTKTPYRVFQLDGTKTGLKNHPPVYIVHTPELAKFSKAYGGTGTNAYVSAYGGGGFDDLNYGIFSKASIDAIPKLNKEEFGDFNPANFWLHDRQAFDALVEISEKSSQGDDYWKGIKVHSSYHNPGRNYQGHYKNPIDFLRITGSKQDIEELKKNPQDFEFVKSMVKKIEAVRQDKSDNRFNCEEILTKEELQKLDAIFNPILGNFKDESGEYNLCKIPIEGVRKNPFNFSAGTVSTTYGKEMKNHNTKEIATGLTSSFASVPTVDIVNGSSAKSMGLDVIGTFGKDNGFTEEIKQGFTPLTKEITSSKEALFNAKQSNKKWLIDTVSQASQKGKSALEHLFFSEKAIKEGSSALGGLSPYKEGDTLFISWGRPDTQKGFPTTLEGYIQLLKNKEVPSQTKERAKFIIGAGPWNKNDEDWIIIQEQMKKIANIENGKYKDNVLYLNGFFTNRIVACADYSNITSRYEPCGITPLESFAGATPVISNNTGGSPDFIKPLARGSKVTNQTGFLTKNAYLVSPQVLGANGALEGSALDSARRMALGKENADCIQDAVDLITNRPEEYKQMMFNAHGAKIDWFENAEFNGGKSAIQRYKESAWAIGQDNKELAGQTRNQEFLANLKGKMVAFGNSPLNKQAEVSEILNNAKSTKNKYVVALVGIIGVLAIGLGAFKLRKNKNTAKTEPKQQVELKVTMPAMDSFIKANKKV